jgi:hypothetical protein
VGVIGVREPEGVVEETDGGVGAIPRISDMAAADLFARRLAACMRARWLGKVVSVRSWSDQKETYAIGRPFGLV